MLTGGPAVGTRGEFICVEGTAAPRSGRAHWCLDAQTEATAAERSSPALWCLVAPTEATAAERSGRELGCLVAPTEATTALRCGREHRRLGRASVGNSEGTPPPPRRRTADVPTVLLRTLTLSQASSQTWRSFARVMRALMASKPRSAWRNMYSPSASRTRSSSTLGAPMPRRTHCPDARPSRTLCGASARVTMASAKLCAWFAERVVVASSKSGGPTEGPLLPLPLSLTSPRPSPRLHRHLNQAAQPSTSPQYLASHCQFAGSFRVTFSLRGLAAGASTPSCAGASTPWISRHFRWRPCAGA